MSGDARINEIVETQGITVQRGASGMTQLRKLQSGLDAKEDSRSSPLMVLRSERNGRRFEFHYQGRLVMSIEPNGAMLIPAGATDVYAAFKKWLEISVGM